MPPERGSTGEDLSKYANYSLFDFWDLFLEDVSKAEIGVRKAFQDLDNFYFGDQEGYTLGNYVPITQGQFDALIDYAWNAGAADAYDLIQKHLVPNNNSLPEMNLRSYQQALEIDAAPGVKIRRGQEFEMFTEGTYDFSH